MKQSGAVEACWAHNPENGNFVDGITLRWVYQKRLDIADKNLTFAANKWLQPDALEYIKHWPWCVQFPIPIAAVAAKFNGPVVRLSIAHRLRAAARSRGLIWGPVVRALLLSEANAARSGLFTHKTRPSPSALRGPIFHLCPVRQPVAESRGRRRALSPSHSQH
ncbi:hypothetical protein EVAR_44727_1 [Eumeta japonica]|uniref:Uncharacterized protein n=1 Tax=Eumeta variegata TaxID=151549 RepID=A0A4C1XGD8_EUMVA|nr:hypothetical protein EVAR_44727_1 [Eumeta japonica]